MIQVLTGRAHRLLAPVIERIGALHRQDKPCILLVPEQFTLQAERELMDRLKLDGFFTIDVLSPSRLSRRVLERTGEDQRAPLSSAGRLMAVHIAMERCEKNLRYYASSVARRGFAEKLSALLTDMKRGGLTPEALKTYAARTETEPEKWADLALLYESYEAQLGGRFGDGEDQLRYVASRLPESGLMSGQNVFVYGFDSLPQQLMGLLCAIAPLCGSLTVALICDGEDATDGELYQPVRQGIARFQRLLADQGLTAEIAALPRTPLESAPAIRHIDEALFSWPFACFEEPQQSVFLTQSMNPFDEATLAARSILALCGEGVDPERVALLYPDQSGYPFAVAAALQASGLPYYTDQKLPAASHGLVRFLLMALRAAANGWRTREMAALMKSGYAPLTPDEACRMENYARAHGVNLSRWAKPFTKGTPEEIAQCEPLRARLMEPLLKMRAALASAKDAQASLSAVMELLTDVRAYDALQKEEADLLAEGLLVRAGQNSQIWQTVLDLLDQLFSLSDGARVPLSRIADRLECGFSAVSLAALPPASHMLHAGTLGHYLSGDMDAVFVLGLNDGVLTKQTDSLLSESERALAQRATGAYLGLTDESRTLFAKLDVKRAMTLPRRLLHLSYAKTGPDGAALRPLSLLSALSGQLFAQLPPCEADALPLSSVQATAELSVLLRAYADGSELPPRWQQTLARLLRDPAASAQANAMLKAAAHRVSATPLPPEEAHRLYGDETLTVSRLEQFADCPFRHFVTYGLRPQILKDWKVEPVDTGVFYHDGLRNFAALAAQCEGYPHIGDEQAAGLADEAVSPLLDELMEGPMGDGARSQAEFRRARRVLRRAAITLTHHLAAGSFGLYRAEASFGYPGGLPPIVLALEGGGEVMLRGRIDRIDRWESGESVYLRVIDYKSSRQDLDAAKTWWGLQLQLLLYLDAAVAALPGAQPAGAFYFYVADPLVDLDTDAQALAEDKLRDLLQLRGVALADVEVLRAMDGGDRPVALPDMLLKSGEIRKTAKALDMPQMKALLRHARDVAAELAQRLLSGETAVRPSISGTALACEHCDYRDACGFDPESPDAGVRTLPPMDMDELRRRLAEPSE
ncbi:MAG: PD-(D/E)XK nuclease family protein [Eubacteriales bacterium]|nr:PD-(D/E)XK nuclease family protein [Eubacteriales bacterium]